MYERMQFADFLVSSALQALSRSLQRIAGGEAVPLRPADSRALVETAEQLLSLWQMVQWSVPRLQFKVAQADLNEFIGLLRSDQDLLQASLQRLSELVGPDLAGSKEAALIAQIATDLRGADSEFRLESRDQRLDRQNELLQIESGRWREYPLLRQITQSDLIEHGMLRAYDRARSLSAKLDGIGPEHRVSAKRLRRAGRWVNHCANHLELIRPALSDSGRTRGWHLSRLAGKLEEQWGLEHLARTVKVMDLKPKARARMEKFLAGQRRRLAKHRQKLALGAFAGSRSDHAEDIGAAVEQLGLSSIALMPLDAFKASSQEGL